MEFQKRVQDNFSNVYGFTPTWNTGSMGTHGFSSGYIISSVSEHVDQFITEFLKVNEKACNQRWKP